MISNTPTLEAKGMRASQMGLTCSMSSILREITNVQGGMATARNHAPRTSDMKRDRDAPHALQMLLPTSSLLQSGVVLVPQFAQLSAPTADLAFFAGGGLSTSAPGEEMSAAGDAVCATAGAASSVVAGSVSSLPDTTRELFSVGQPAHALVPPVPSHRPSPGHVPPPALVCAPVAEAGLEVGLETGFCWG